MELTYQKKNVYEVADEAQMGCIETFSQKYKDFLAYSKTERDAVRLSVAMAERAGYRPFRFGDPLSVGDKRYYNNRGKKVFCK